MPDHRDPGPYPYTPFPRRTWDDTATDKTDKKDAAPATSDDLNTRLLLAARHASIVWARGSPIDRTCFKLAVLDKAWELHLHFLKVQRFTMRNLTNVKEWQDVTDTFIKAVYDQACKDFLAVAGPPRYDEVHNYVRRGLDTLYSADTTSRALTEKEFAGFIALPEVESEPEIGRLSVVQEESSRVPSVADTSDTIDIMDTSDESEDEREVPILAINGTSAHADPEEDDVFQEAESGADDLVESAVVGEPAGAAEDVQSQQLRHAATEPNGALEASSQAPNGHAGPSDDAPAPTTSKETNLHPAALTEPEASTDEPTPETTALPTDQPQPAVTDQVGTAVPTPPVEFAATPTTSPTRSNSAPVVQPTSILQPAPQPAPLVETPSPPSTIAVTTPPPQIAPPLLADIPKSKKRRDKRDKADKACIVQ